MNKIILVVIIVLIAIVGGYFLLKGGYQAPESGAPTSGAPSANDNQSSSAGVKEITVVGTEFALNPSTITAKAGEKIKITFKNSGGAPHNLVIEGLSVKTKTISSGTTDTVEFTAKSKGTFKIFCSIPGHRETGMEGLLLIE